MPLDNETSPTAEQFTEKEQFERNRNSLEARVEQIPAEIELETAAIRARFLTAHRDYFP